MSFAGRAGCGFGPRARCRPARRVAAAAALVAVALAFCPPEGRAEAAGEAAAGPLVLIGLSGLTWADVSAAETPALWAALERGGAVAGVVTRSVRPGSCPAEGWLALGAGEIVGETPASPLSDIQTVDPASCAPLSEVVAGVIPGWDALTGDAGRGSLRGWLDEMGFVVAGIGPGAALALADADGRVGTSYTQAPTSTAAWGEAVTRAVNSGAAAVVVDVGVLSADLTVGELDARIGAILQALTAATSLSPAEVLVASLSRPAPALGVALLTPPPTQGTANLGLLRSAATHRAGLVVSTDVTAVLESHLLAAPVGAVDPWTASPADWGAADAVDSLRDMALHASARRALGPAAWIAALVVAAIGLFGPLVYLSSPRRRAGGERGRNGAAARGAAAWQAVALCAGAFPIAGFVVNALPWWRAPLAGAVWLAGSVAVAVGIGLGGWTVARLGTRGAMGTPLGGAGVVGAIGALVLLADPFSGAVFTRDAPLGADTLLGARFFGYANTTFAVLVVSALLAAALAAAEPWRRARRGWTITLIGVVGIAGAVVAGHADLGADLGGAVTIAVAFGVLALAAGDATLRPRSVALAGALGVAAAAAAAFWDYSRGPGRWTHLGAFVDQAVAGGLGEVLARKAGMWLRMSAQPLVGLVLAGLVVLALRRRGGPFTDPRVWRDLPLRRPLTMALMTALALGS
ncbi:MAG: hypothetical protein LBD97_09085, partial [Bifidobacteriaceae bacterium]|nr:hypothetical protein [Bifidobacteriaceae bacterium]